MGWEQTGFAESDIAGATTAVDDDAEPYLEYVVIRSSAGAAEEEGFEHAFDFWPPEAAPGLSAAGSWAALDADWLLL